VMSGFEVIGVVLGAIPLVISALEHYADGVRTIRRLIEYKWELNTLITTLETEDVLFRNTCEALLDGIEDAGAMEELLKDPGGHLWKEKRTAERLKTRLSTSYDVFFKRIIDMNNALESFKERLGLSSDGTVSTFYYYFSILGRELAL
jgi:hypothetical protein